MPMAATTTTISKTTTATTTKLVCFSFAAYAKTLIENLKSLNIPVLPGLTDQEFTSIESNFGFSFPPDLRSILQEGLPVGPHFPNWRSSSPQQLQILLNLPFLNLSKNITRDNFWVDSWGSKPDGDNKQALATLKIYVDQAPVLVPIYGNCYIPCSPNTAGNPVFYVDDSSARVLSFDLAWFFQQVEIFKTGNNVHNFIRPTNLPKNNDDSNNNKNKVSINMPAWAATTARKVEFWTEVAERGKKVAARDDTRGWWNCGDGKDCLLGDCLEDVFWKLRDGGWREDEVKEMMMMDGCDEEREKDCVRVHNGKVDVLWHVRVLSMVLLRAGWSREDVVYSLDLQDQEDSKCSLDFPLPNGSCARQDDDHQNSTIKQLMNMQSLEV